MSVRVKVMGYLAPSLARTVLGVVITVYLLTLLILTDLPLSGGAKGHKDDQTQPSPQGDHSYKVGATSNASPLTVGDQDFRHLFRARI